MPELTIQTNNPAVNLKRGFPVFVLAEVKKHCTIVAVPLPAEISAKQNQFLIDFGKFCYNRENEGFRENHLLMVADNMAVPPTMWSELEELFGEMEIVSKVC